jgi:hypothetical protein
MQLVNRALPLQSTSQEYFKTFISKKYKKNVRVELGYNVMKGTEYFVLL